MSRDPSIVSKNMSKIHSKDTSIELLLRKALWHKGYRYRKNYKVLPGSPDIVLTKYKIAIFCDSEFFHGKDWDSLKTRLEKGKNPEFWSFCFSVILLSIFGDRISLNIPTSAYKQLKNPSGI